MSKPKLITILGTRPEIIRLSRIIPKFDVEFDHVLVHTGQNFDTRLNDIFFEELEIRKPNFYLGINGKSLANVLGDVLIKTEELILELKPDGIFILGDTNSSIAAIIAKRMQIPIYHWEAGNRSFDENVPEEANRKIVDHVADFNIAYSGVAYQNLLNEGISKQRLLISGSPLKEVIDFYLPKILQSSILSDLNLLAGNYFVASVHRQENVDDPKRLMQIMESLRHVKAEWGLPILISTHPRTKNKLQDLGVAYESEGMVFHEPFGYFDYMKLQMDSKCVISDSGSVSEESAIANFPAITIRDSMERPEALAARTILMTGLTAERVIDGIKWAIAERDSIPPEEYIRLDASKKVTELILSTIMNFESWSGVRRLQK